MPVPGLASVLAACLSLVAQTTPAAPDASDSPPVPTAGTPATAATPLVDGLSVVVERCGFRLQRPDDTWIVYASGAAAAGAAYTLTLYPRDSQSLPSVVVYAAEREGGATAEDARAAAVATLEQGSGTILDQGTRAVAGRTAVSVRARAAGAGGLVYQTELHYLVSDPFLYALQCNWAADGERPSGVLDPLLDSFEIFAATVAETTPEDARLEALAARCGSELSWCASWTEASERARAEDRLVLVVYEDHSVLDLPRTLATGPLIDADLLALEEERFVLLRLGAGDDAPFRASTAYGLSEHSWGASVLFVTPAGRVLEDVGISNACLLFDRARRALAAGVEAAPAVAAPHVGARSPERPARDPEQRLAQAGLHLRRGEPEAARPLLEPADTAAGHALRAALFRQLRQGEDALQEVALAQRDAAPGLAADLAVERAVLLMRLARWDDADAAFRAAIAEFPDGLRAGEAQFWLGALEMLRAGAPAGEDRWRALAEQRPDDRWAWKAAANLLGRGSFVNAGERLDWPEPEVFAAAARPAAAPLDDTKAGQAERDARAFLLAAQRPDGSWIAPMDAFSVSPGGYTFAITAICGSALLPGASLDGEQSAAVERALAYELAIHRLGLLAGGSDLMGVYSIWARAFVLRFLAQCRAAHIGDEVAIGLVADALVQSVLQGQHEGGGWPYVVLPNSPSRGGLDPSASFLTAGVLIALLDARAAGTEVPQAPIDRGLAFLRTMRRADGGFRYMRDVPESADNPEAAGRGPVCALALHRGGERDVPGLRRALDLFLSGRDALKAVWGRDLCHTGPQGQGAHYLFFDYGFAAAAVAQLPKAERARYGKALLQDVLQARDAEGAYADMPSLGRAYGTAMALFTFQQLGDRRAGR